MSVEYDDRAPDTAKAEDEKIVDEAKKRFKRCQDWESKSRLRFRDDTKFVEGDSDNNYQWDAAIRSARLLQQRPCLTINKTRQHCLQIVNDARQNKAQIRITAVGGQASYESAKVFEGICRHIEYQSNAMETYESAAWHQVTGGWGYWRVVTEYVDGDTGDQEIFIKRERDPLRIYLDPDIEEFDGSDAAFGFAYKDVPRDEFKAQYPNHYDDVGGEPLDNTRSDGWDDKDHVRVAEYFRKVETRRGGKHRELVETKVEWFKIAGSKIVDRNIWPGRYIPFVRVIGEETVIDGELDRKGHVRALKDPQRMYNYMSSANVEELAMQTKAPWVGPMAAFEGLETYWSAANVETRAWLPWNHKDDDDKPVPAPTKTPPHQSSGATIEALKIAQQEMMMASGQYQSQFGENENAKSGVAIQTRQRQGDNATYHYIDHLAQAIKFTGKILIDLIPKVYDTARIKKIMAEDGDQSDVHIDPSAPKAHQMVAPAAALGGNTPNGMMPITPNQAQQLSGDPDVADQIKTIFNPTIGRYDVEADIGPAYATRRQETFNALSQIMSQNEKSMEIAGDLLFRAADFPMADKLAERWQRAIPPQILGQAPPPQVQQLEQQMQAQTQGFQKAVSDLTQQLAEARMQLKDRDTENQRKDYEAETSRMSASAAIDPEAFKPVIRELISQMIGTPIVPVMAAHAAADQAMQPAPEEQAGADAIPG